eukprot:Clim_evm76s152 gene=Clim_evmTU76s152
MKSKSLSVEELSLQVRPALSMSAHISDDERDARRSLSTQSPLRVSNDQATPSKLSQESSDEEGEANHVEGANGRCKGNFFEDSVKEDASNKEVCNGRPKPVALSLSTDAATSGRSTLEPSGGAVAYGENEDAGRVNAGIVPVQEAGLLKRQSAIVQRSRAWQSDMYNCIDQKRMITRPRSSTVDGSVGPYSQIVKAGPKAPMMNVTTAVYQTAISQYQMALGSRDTPIDDVEWSSMLDEYGRVKDVLWLRMRVLRCGCQPSVRKFIWNILFEVYKPSETYEDKQLKLKQREERYARMKSRALLMMSQRDVLTPEQKRNLSTIHKDVHRNDRDHEFFAGENNPNLTKLRNILTVQCLVQDAETGYVQGMTDLAGMHLYVMDNEAEAFWTFSSMISWMRAIFRDPQLYMSKMIKSMNRQLKRIDPPFHAYLESVGCKDMLFAYRWLLLNMKREFTFEDSVVVTETIWSKCPFYRMKVQMGGNPFAVYVSLAILMQERDQIMEQKMDHDGLFMHFSKQDPKDRDMKAILHCAEQMMWQTMPPVMLRYYAMHWQRLQEGKTDLKPLGPIRPGIAVDDHEAAEAQAHLDTLHKSIASPNVDKSTYASRSSFFKWT